MARSWKDHSRTDWRNAGECTPSDDRIKIGCLQRIADATEAMAKSYNLLREERDRYQRWYEQEQQSNARLRRSNAALRGLLKRMKKGKR